MIGGEWIGAERLVAGMVSAVKVRTNIERVSNEREDCDREISSIDTLSRSEESLSFPSLD
jgi:hypothetical protein